MKKFKTLIKKIVDWVYKRKRFLINIQNPDIDYLWHLKIRNRDSKQGLDFTSAEPEEFGITDKTVVRSSPSGNKFLANTIKHLKVNSGNSILDIGCGKGDAIRLFMTFPFKTISGIEYSPIITEIARKNFSVLDKKKRVKIINCNAVDFEEYRNYDFFYLYHPFTEEIMRKVIPKIINQRTGLKTIIIYNNPVCANVFFELGLQTHKKFSYSTQHKIFVYYLN